MGRCRFDVYSPIAGSFPTLILSLWPWVNQPLAMGSDAVQRLYSPPRCSGPWDKSLWAHHISFACIPASISLLQPSLRQAVPDLSSMEVLQTKMWMAMPLRPRGSPAPHKVCSPCGQTPGLGSECQAVRMYSPILLHPIPRLGISQLPCHFSLWPIMLLAFL